MHSTQLLFRGLLLCGGLYAGSQAARAQSDLVFDFTISLSETNPSLFLQNTLNPQHVNAGDKVTVRYSFADEYGLKISPLDEGQGTLILWPWLLHVDDPGQFKITEIAFSLIDERRQGTWGIPSWAMADQMSLEAHLGPYLQLFVDPNSWVSFRGFETSFTVESLTGDGWDCTAWMNDGHTNLALERVSYATITAVPEPSTYGLMGAGALAALGFMRRHRRRNAS